MNTRIQSFVNSDFDKLSTANEVIAGLNLAGKTVLITGGHSGLGLESTKALATAGAHIIIGARNTSCAHEQLRNIPNVTVRMLDLSDLISVNQFSDEILNLKIRIDVLLCNAGIMACPEARVGQGWELQFATNHIGHYVLTNLIWDTLNPGARIVCVSSAAHHLSPIRWHDVHFASEYDKWLAYGQSKTANALFALQLDEYGMQFNIRAFSLHPGKIFTPLQRHLEEKEMIEAGWLDANGKPADPTFKTPQQGAATQVWAATSPKLKEMGGLYCEDCEVAKSADQCLDPFFGVCKHATDLEEAKRLWDYTAELTGINRFSSMAKYVNQAKLA